MYGIATIVRQLLPVLLAPVLTHYLSVLFIFRRQPDRMTVNDYG